MGTTTCIEDTSQEGGSLEVNGMIQTMSLYECQQLIAEPRLGVIAVARSSRAPLCVPMWYAYEPGGDVGIWTGRSSAKAKLMRRYGRFSLCVQNELPPYKFVSVEGPICSFETIDYERELRPLIYRYLGEGAGQKYLDDYGDSAAAADDLWIRMTPASWYSEDYAEK